MLPLVLERQTLGEDTFGAFSLGKARADQLTLDQVLCGTILPRLTIRIRRQVRNRLTARSLAVHADWADLGVRRMTCVNAHCCLLDSCESHGQSRSAAAVAS